MFLSILCEIIRYGARGHQRQSHSRFIRVLGLSEPLIQSSFFFNQVPCIASEASAKNSVPCPRSASSHEVPSPWVNLAQKGSDFRARQCFQPMGWDPVRTCHHPLALKKELHEQTRPTQLSDLLREHDLKHNIYIVLEDPERDLLRLMSSLAPCT